MGLFDFNANADPADPSSGKSLEIRRQIALAMMNREKKGYPKNLGEGLTALGDAFAERSQMNALQNQLGAYEKYNIAHPPPDAATLLQQPTRAVPQQTSDASDVTPAERPPVVAQDDTPDQVPLPAPRPQMADVAPPPDAQDNRLADVTGMRPPTTAPAYAPTALASPPVQSDMPPVTGAPPVAAPPGNARDAIAAQLALRAPAQGVPPVNPMQPAGATLPSAPPASLPASGPAPLPGTPPSIPPQAGLPAAPSGFQLAQGAAPNLPQINRVTPPVTMPPPGPAVVQPPPDLPLTPAEVAGMRLKQQGIQMDDDNRVKQGDLLIQAGKAQRDQQDAANRAAWQAKVETQRQRQLSQEQAERGAPLEQQKLIEAQRNADISRRFGGAVPYQQFVADMSKSYDATQQLSNTLPTLRQAKQALAQSYTGAGSEFKLDSGKLLRQLGVPGNYAPEVATEMLQSRMKAIAGGLIKSTVGSQNISDADREFVEKAYSGTIKMEPESLRRLLGIAEDTTIRSINRHNDRLLGVANDPAQDAGLRSQYHVPMQYGDQAVAYLKAHPETADMFDKKFGKGHAKAVLAGTRYGE